MGRKKPKDPPQSDAVSTPSGIFATLFADVPEETTAAASSLFSDNNPFRRKPQQQPSPVLESAQQTQIPNNGEPVNRDSSEEKKSRKRKNEEEEKPSVDLGSAIEAAWEKKNKKKHRESNEETKGTELAAKEGKKEKKRKREELEKDWEEKRYGIAVEKGEEGDRKVGGKRKTLDNPADMMVSKEGFDDEDKLLRTVFVGNLPLKVKKKTLLKEFKKFGEVESVRIRSVPIQDTKKPRKGAILAKKINDSADSVHAYIVFKTEESAQASLSHNMAVVEGNHIRVDRACPPRKKLKGESTPLYDNKRTVFVGNLPFDVKDEELYQLFCGLSKQESSVEAIRVVRDPHLNVGKGIAYVLFKTKEAANFVLKKRNLKLRDRELRLSHAKADATPSKRPNPSPAKAPSTPAKKLSLTSRSPSSNINKSNRKANASYQGVRATKSDVKKKIHGLEKTKERKEKRPSVAARKAKAKQFKDNGSSKQAGVKRKLDSRTPDSSLRTKKMKKNR